MPMSVVLRFVESLERARWSVVVQLTGRGEPTLHPQWIAIARMLSEWRLPRWRVQLWTGGFDLQRMERQTDDFESKLVEIWDRSGLHDVVLNVRGGPLAERMVEMAPRVMAVLGGSWGEREDDGLLDPRRKSDRRRLIFDRTTKITNQGGAIPGLPVGEGWACRKTQQEMFVSWNGTVLVCEEDWAGEHPVGSVQVEHLADVWLGSRMMRARGDLRLRRDLRPCARCSRRYYDWDIA
jgi:MoaA/NifB/PqqE/SkfB family radical SAM enzyme